MPPVTTIPRSDPTVHRGEQDNGFSRQPRAGTKYRVLRHVEDETGCPCRGEEKEFGRGRKTMIPMTINASCGGKRDLYRH